jgi:hypothetical protein
MNGYKDLLAKLSSLVSALENGALTRNELDALEDVTRKLHERSIILRYKAFEGNTEKAEERATIVENQEQEEKSETQASESAEQMEEIQAEESEETAFDFDMFNTEAHDEVVEPLEEPETESDPETSAEDLSVPPAQEHVEPVAEIIETPEVPEADIHVLPADPVNIPEGDSKSAFVDKFSKPDNSVAHRFSSSPLDSLIGAFGLNERLRYINDLFDGSSEKFSDAIKTLDSQQDLQSALTKASQYAAENEWELEEEVVAEFMNYVNRRYA